MSDLQERVQNCCAFKVDTKIEIDDDSCANELEDISDDTVQTKCVNKDVQESEQSEIDGSNYKQSYAARKSTVEGMMDIALLTANANQLRFLISYNSKSQMYYISLGLIIISLILQVTVGIGLIFKRKIKNCGRRKKFSQTNDLLIGGIFLITVVNVFVASFTTTDK